MSQKLWPGQTYQQEVDYLKTWVGNRLAWLDAAILPFGSDVLATEPANDFSLTISPNPSASDVTLHYRLRQRGTVGTVHLTLIDAAGRTIRTIAWPDQSAGKHQQLLSARLLSAGPGDYFLQLNANGQPISRKILRY